MYMYCSNSVYASMCTCDEFTLQYDTPVALIGKHHTHICTHKHNTHPLHSPVWWSQWAGHYTAEGQSPIAAVVVQVEVRVAD